MKLIIHQSIVAMRISTFCFVLLMSAVFQYTASSANEPLPNGPPAWFVGDVNFHTQGEGIWLTDNASYKSEQEPWDFYVMQWRAGPDSTSMAGQMTALKDGVASNGEFWNFSQYWDPAKKQAIVLQNGWGVFGSGPLTQTQSPDELEMTQTFTRFDGVSNVQGHLIKRKDAGSYESVSYLVEEDGKRVQGRYYLWKKRQGDAEGTEPVSE